MNELSAHESPVPNERPVDRNARDLQNVAMAGQAAEVDRLNTEFYDRFPFPQTMWLDAFEDPLFVQKMLNQSVGDWTHRRIPREPRIWVAGCGSSQAVATALHFPTGRVVGSDLSEESLALSAATAENLGLTYLELRQESLLESEYRDEFDYVVCTGVIHHMADPAEGLTALVRALKPDGILELMVYNQYHRLATSAFQKALRLLVPEKDESERFESQVSVAQVLARDLGDGKNSMGRLLRGYRESPEAIFADALLQPVEHSYTVESLAALAAGAGAELVQPRVSPWDAARERFWWDVALAAPAIRERWEELSRRERWSLSNSLLLESSPQLWFYLQRKNGGPRRSDTDLHSDFLSNVFVPASTMRRTYLKEADSVYHPSARAAPWPGVPKQTSHRRIVEALDGESTMGQILDRLGIDRSFTALQALRVQLTTLSFPFCVASGSATESPGEPSDSASELRYRRAGRGVRKRIRSDRNQ